MYCEFRARTSGDLSVSLFSTQAGVDNVTIAGNEYSGLDSPDGVAMQAGQLLVWETDAASTDYGWLICLATSSTAYINQTDTNTTEYPLDTLPPSADALKSTAYWDLLDPGCDIEEECIKSHPSAGSGGIDGIEYPPSAYCQFRAKRSGTLNVTLFDTESYYDVLVVGGLDFSGNENPQGFSVEAGDSLVWESDGGIAAAGFIVCLVVGDGGGGFDDDFGFGGDDDWSGWVDDGISGGNLGDDTVGDDWLDDDGSAWVDDDGGWVDDDDCACET
jgi:hypothetical protein